MNKKRVDVKLYAETSLQFCDDGYVVYSLVKTMIGVMLLLTTTTDSQPTDGAVPCSRGLTRYTEKNRTDIVISGKPVSIPRSVFGLPKNPDYR